MLSMEQGKRITIDVLAHMMSRSFEHLEKRVDTLETNINNRFEEMNDRFDHLEKVVNGHENRISNLEDNVRVLKTRVGK